MAMKNKLIIFSKLLICTIFLNAHASPTCKAVTLLMTYEEVAKALNGKIENCSAIDAKIDKSTKEEKANNPYYDYTHYGSPNCDDPTLVLGFSHGYLSFFDDNDDSLSKDGTTIYPSHFKPCLSEEVIQLGMTYQQISKILKKEGKLDSKPYTNSYGIYMVDYTWDIEAVGSVSISFENNRAVSINKID